MKNSLTYFVITIIILIGVVLVVIGGLWFGLTLSKISLAEALVSYPANKPFIELFIGVCLIVGSIMYLAKYEKQNK